ncbi:hypothetical protein KFK09_029323 [Dendrobium nobile]|uniref:Uncharacterized protein n=1 Tax=Dendrobium nobile TaxID=94219 RepID=A0A8T3A0F0_DENNO|nr:hypothetical protein KFK09_029323 [Dendrobium nobile]
MNEQNKKIEELHLFDDTASDYEIIVNHDPLSNRKTIFLSTDTLLFGIIVVHPNEFSLHCEFIQPARDSMMWHLGYKIVEDFKVRFDKALGSGEGFSAVASNCFQSVMFAFNEACEGSLREILIRFIELYIITIVRIVE